MNRYTRIVVAHTAKASSYYRTLSSRATNTSLKTNTAMDADAFRKAAHSAIEEIIKYNSDVSTSKLPVLPSIKPGYLRPELPTSAPEHPESWDTIQPDIASKIVPGLTHWQSPDFMAFFPACATYPSILGEMYSSAFTAPAFNWLCSPACTELETIVLDWLADAFHLPKDFRSDSPNGGGGVIQGSASEAIVTVMVAARERYINRAADRAGLKEGSTEREKWMMSKRSTMLALSSDQAHSSTAKGARIAGTYHRTVETRWEDGLAVQAGTLRKTIEDVIAEGLDPYYITLSYGTTSTCAVDPLHELVEVLKDYPDIWVHIDAAYAGTALICPEYANVQASLETSHANGETTTNGIPSTKQAILNKLSELVPATNGTSTSASAYHSSLYNQEPLDHPTHAFPNSTSVLSHIDSFNTNLHKWLLVSFDASLLYLRSRTDLTSAMSITPAYLQNKHTDSGLVTDYRDWQIPLGRRFRALKIWFVVRSYGLEGMRGHIRRTVRLGEYFEGLVKSGRGEELFELVAEPAFGLTCFRVRDGVVRDVLRTKQTSGRVLGDVGGGDEKIETETTMNESPFGSNEQQEPTAENTSSLVETTNALTKAIVETINDSGTLFLTSSHTHGKTFIRVVNGNENGNNETMKRAFDRIVKTTEDLLGDLEKK